MQKQKKCMIQNNKVKWNLLKNKLKNNLRKT